VIDKDTVRPVIDGLFRQRRRGWRGLGGMGNPRETWDDARSLLAMAFLLDTDSVFTVAYWACASLGAAVERARATLAGMVEAAGQLADLTTEGLADTDELDVAGRALNRALFHNTRTGASSARRNLQLAQEGLDAFATRLAPYADPAGTGTDRRTPSEARAVLREGVEELVTELEAVEAAGDNVTSLLSALASVNTRSLLDQVLRAVKNHVDGLRQRMVSESAAQRVADARNDLVKLASDSVLLGTLLADCLPILARGTFPVSATGSGSGAGIVGTASAPYELLDGVSGRLRLDVDGDGPVTFIVSSQPNGLVLNWPLAGPLGVAFYNVLAPGTFTVLVDGRAGVPVVVPFIPGGYTAAAVVALFGPGTIPENPLGFAFLMPAVVNPSPGMETVQLAYRVGNPTPPNTGMGCYIEVTGDVALMNAFGFPGADEDDPTQKTARIYWTSVTQLAVVEGLSHQLYGADELGERVRFTPVTNVVTSGCRGITDPAVLSFALTNYLGDGVWNPALGELTLSGDDLARVRPGDRVVVDGVPANTFTVTGLVADGVRMALTSGTSPAAGSYVVTVAPPAGAVTAGMTLEYVDRGMTVYGRISLVLHDVSGRLLVTLDRRPSCYPYAPSGTIRYRVLDDRLSLTSTDNSPAGSLEVVAVGADAAPALGLAAGATLGLVDQLAAAGGGLGTAGIVEGDYVYDTGGLLAEVDAVLTDTRMRISVEVEGVYADTVSVRNRKYDLYNRLTAALAAVSLADAEMLRRLAAECVRAANAVEAGNDLAAELGTLDTELQAATTAIGSFRSDFGALGAYMLDCRSALEEIGADRALELLVSGDLVSLLSESADGATYSRQLMRQTRQLSRGLLGTSVYAAAARQEADALSVEPPLSLGVGIPAQQSFGGPRSTKR